ncbi:MAG: hypothetical protein Q9201_006790 [Fulgogasparrea decipioides]
MSQPLPHFVTARDRPKAKLSKQPSAISLRRLQPAANPNPKISKRASTASIRTLIPKKSSHSLKPSLSPSPSISAPAPPQKLLRLSELLDPDDLIRAEDASSAPATTSQQQSTTPGAGAKDRAPSSTTTPQGQKRVIVHSPSGNRLDAQTFAQRPDRPLTLAERQQKIREETKRQTDEARRAALARATAKKERGCCVVM